MFAIALWFMTLVVISLFFSIPMPHVMGWGDPDRQWPGALDPRWIDDEGNWLPAHRQPSNATVAERFYQPKETLAWMGELLWGRVHHFADMIDETGTEVEISGEWVPLRALGFNDRDDDDSDEWDGDTSSDHDFDDIPTTPFHRPYPWDTSDVMQSWAEVA